MAAAHAARVDPERAALGNDLGWRRSLRDAGLTTDWPWDVPRPLQNALHELVGAKVKRQLFEQRPTTSHKIINLMEAR